MQSSTPLRAASPRAFSPPAREVPACRRGWYEDGHVKEALRREFRDAGALHMQGFVPEAALETFLRELAPTGRLGEAAASGTLALHGFAAGPRFRELLKCLMGPECVLSRGPALLAPAEAGPELRSGARVQVGLDDSSPLGFGDVRVAKQTLPRTGFTLSFDVRPAAVPRPAPTPAPPGRRQPRDAHPGQGEETR
ncbi:MAG: hypothetical protein AAF447_03820 [Myxococcota bacterium]